MADQDENLPTVTGNCERSFAMLERSCLVHLRDEQEKVAPDNALIATLCDCVRVLREVKPPMIEIPEDTSSHVGSGREYLSVHDQHCCKIHGCKYGDDDCPVGGVLGNRTEPGIKCECCWIDETYANSLNISGSGNITIGLKK